MEYEEDIVGKYRKITRMLSENIITAVIIFLWEPISKRICKYHFGEVKSGEVL